MAIDTRAKRQSAAWVGFPGPPSLLPTGTIDQAARQQVSWTYAGILVQAPFVGVLCNMNLMGVGY